MAYLLEIVTFAYGEAADAKLVKSNRQSGPFTAQKSVRLIAVNLTLFPFHR